jgi:hypothetical protein
MTVKCRKILNVFSLTASMASFFVQDLFWEQLHEQHNTVIPHKY